MIENGHLVLHLGGELDKEAAVTVARLIGQSKGDFAIDFSSVASIDVDCFDIVEEAISRCPYRLSLRGAERLS